MPVLVLAKSHAVIRPDVCRSRDNYILSRAMHNKRLGIMSMDLGRIER